MKDGSYLGKSFGVNDGDDVGGEPLVSESVRETVTDKSVKPVSRVGLANDFDDNLFGAKRPAERDLDTDSMPLGNTGTIGAGQAPAPGSISPLKPTQMLSLDPPRAERPASGTSKYSAVVFSQPRLSAEAGPAV